MNDLISRQAAIDFIDAGHLVNPNEPRWSDNEVVNFLKSRPSAQPDLSEYSDKLWRNAYERGKRDAQAERKTGKWILHQEQEKNIFGVKTIECSRCGDKCLVQCVEKEKYCRNCGAKMEGTE